ncbi:hypothetical protein SAMN05421770_101620 [Granulicella rosea]|uniref:Uncharacterized protein n=1 Tax=Granulicella rosea TaxID=474952 RepID=A0A239DSV2_9BACT|nr:hypothetical protein [Granulicella rosea]SNS35211.1 hypothetical protein SAMN05421770_101620 [Granulicella rosea]
MSVIDNTRKLMQDLIAPELKALQVQVSSMERSILSSLAASDKTTKAQFEAMDARMKALEGALLGTKDVLVAQTKSLEGKVDSNHASILHSLDIDKRLEQLERLQRDSTSAPRQQ